MNAKASQKERWRDFLEVVFLVIILAIFIRVFFLGMYRVSSSSMAPTLLTGDFIWASKVAYGIKLPFSHHKILQKMPEKGDLVVVHFFSQEQSMHKIMRVIAHPGDHVEIKNQQAWVNENKVVISMSQINSVELNQRKDMSPLVVPPGAIFVMFDNREEEGGLEILSDGKEDSLGVLVSLDQIDAQVKGVWFSLDWSASSTESNESPRLRWERVGTQL